MSSQRPAMHVGSSAVQVLMPGHAGEDGHISMASNRARSAAITAVSNPPCWQPQQSARVRVHCESAVQPPGSGAAQSHVRHPLASVAKPYMHEAVGSHARGAHASSQRPSSLHRATTSAVHSEAGHGTFAHARATGLVRDTANVGHSQHVGAANTQS